MSWLRALYRAAFLTFERLGVHVTPRHFAFPIPDTGALDRKLWGGALEPPPGIEFREPEQLALLQEIARAYGPELAALAARPDAADSFHLRNRHFETVDAEIYYGLLRRRRPRLVIEAGSGFSTLLALEALEANAQEGHPGTLQAFDPFAGRAVRHRQGGVLELRQTPIEQAPLEAFLRLGAGDILFIDSSHVLHVGSDVRFLFGEVLPRLAAGVLVHVHDVFLPAHYPREWVVERMRFWNEQYVLQAFLEFNSSFRVVWASYFMALRHPAELSAAFPSFRPGHEPGSFWIERIG